MKKLKLDILLTFFLTSSHFHQKKTMRLTYTDLYTLLPYAPSSIRGALREFVDKGMMVQFMKSKLVSFELSVRGLAFVAAKFGVVSSTATLATSKWTVLVYTGSGYGSEHYKKTANLLKKQSFILVRSGVWMKREDPSTNNRAVLLKIPDLVVFEHATSYSLSDSGLWHGNAGLEDYIISVKKIRFYEKEFTQLSDTKALRTTAVVRKYRRLLLEMREIATYISRNPDIIPQNKSEYLSALNQISLQCKNIFPKL